MEESESIQPKKNAKGKSRISCSCVEFLKTIAGTVS